VLKLEHICAVDVAYIDVHKGWPFKNKLGLTASLVIWLIGSWGIISQKVVHED